MTGALGTSAALHVGMLALVLLMMSLRPEREPAQPPRIDYDLVFLRDPGPGGGGGGSPAPAPPKPVAVPETKPPDPPPVTPPVEIPVEPPPVPVLTVPIETAEAEFIQVPGTTSVSIAHIGGGGEGGGLGRGSGTGMGEGEDAGLGGGRYGPGSGVQPPTAVREVQPDYTSEGMRNKIQGIVLLELEILPDGTVGRVQVVRSLDNGRYGLDAAAITAARQWLFRPARDRNGEPVLFRAEMELTFRLH